MKKKPILMALIFVAFILMATAAFAHDHYHADEAHVQQGRVLLDSDFNASDARARIERLQRLMPKVKPLEPMKSVMPELGGVVVLANTPVSLEVDLGGDLAIGITPQ